jgi:hypothetical protein
MSETDYDIPDHFPQFVFESDLSMLSMSLYRVSITRTALSANGCMEKLVSPLANNKCNIFFP